MSDSPVLNPGLGPNEIVSPGLLHTEPPFVRPVYGTDEPVTEPEPETEPETEPEEAPKARKSSKK